MWTYDCYSRGKFFFRSDSRYKTAGDAFDAITVAQLDDAECGLIGFTYRLVELKGD